MNRDGLIDKIYACATDVSLWPGVLTELMGEIDANKAVLCCNNDETLIWAAPVGLGANYTDHVYRIREIDDFHAMRRFLPKGKALLSHEIISLEDFRKTAFYETWAAPNECVHVAGAILAIDDDEWTALRFFRPDATAPFEPETKSFLDGFIPHMTRAIAISRKLSNAEQRIRGYERVFGLLNCGLILLNRKREIVFQNRAVEQLLAQRDPLGVAGGRLIPRDRNSRRELDALVDEALNPGDKEFQGGVRLMRYVDCEKHPIQAWVAPIQEGAPGFEWAGDSAQAACFLIDPDERTPLPRNVLEKLYGLTPRESALVHDLLRGERLSEIAVQEGKSINTIKTHLRSVFSKTDTNRQNELITLIQPIIDIASGPDA